GAAGLFLAAMLIRLAARGFTCDASAPDDFTGTASGVAVGAAGASPLVEAAGSSGSGDRGLGSQSKAPSGIKGGPGPQGPVGGGRIAARRGSGVLWQRRSGAGLHVQGP